MLQETAITKPTPPSFASNDMLARLPNEVLSRVLQHIDTVHLLKEVMLLSKHWRNIIAQTADAWASIKIQEPSFHPCALLPIVHHIRSLDLHLDNTSWLLSLYERVPEFRHLIRFSLRTGVARNLDDIFTSNGWLACDRLEVLDIRAHTSAISLNKIMSAFPKLTSLTFENYAGFGPVPQDGFPPRVGLTSVLFAIHVTSRHSPAELTAILKACPNLRNLSVYPGHKELLDTLEKFPHRLESLDWDFCGSDVPWVGNNAKTSTKRTQCCGHGGDGSLLKHFRSRFAYDTELNRILTKYGRTLETLHIVLDHIACEPAVFPPLQYDHTFFKRLQTLVFIANTGFNPFRSLEIVVTILKLCDIHVFEHFTLSCYNVPLDIAVFRCLTAFSHLHTVRLLHLTCTEGVEIYWTAMAMLGDHAPLTVVELRAVPLTAAQLVILASVSTLQHVGLFALSDQLTTTDAIHQFFLKLQQHKRLQSIALDEVEVVKRDTLIEYIGKIPSLTILTICTSIKMFTNQDIADFIQLYPAISLKYASDWSDKIELRLEIT